MDFQASADLFREYLKTIPWGKLQKKAGSASSTGKTVGLIVCPWHFSAVPWFDVVIAALYLDRGWNVRLVWDDLLFGDPEQYRLQDGILAPVVDDLGKHLAVTRLSDLKDSPINETTDALLLKRIAFLSAVWKARGPEPSQKLQEFTREYHSQLSMNFPKIRTVVNDVRCDHWIIPHGVWGNSGLFLSEGRRTGARTATYDCGAGMIFLGIDDVAGHQMDIAAAIERGSFLRDPLHQKKIFAMADEEISKRLHGVDIFKYQTANYDDHRESRSFDILMPMNVDYDSAALGKNRFFEDAFEWVYQTVEHILERTEASIAVREHPAERFEGRTRDIGVILNKRFGDHPRFKFYAAADPVNTYRLMESCSLVLPMSSTVGLEAAISGKNVVVEADSYFARCAFVKCATSKENYFDLISRTLKDSQSLPDGKRELARLCFFLTLTNRIVTDFTPEPSDFEKWVKRSFTSLSKDPTVTDIMDTFEKKIPACLITAERVLGLQRAKDQRPSIASQVKGWFCIERQ